MNQKIVNDNIGVGEPGVQPIRKTVWDNISFFLAIMFFGMVGAPIYLARFGISPSEIVLFIFYLFSTTLSITLGYHRLFAHATFKANTWVRFLVLFFGAAAFQQSALKWASQHRDHHRYVDTDQDPYNIKKGFFYAHIGWLIFWEHPRHYENAKDLQKSRLLMNQHRFYTGWAILSGILVPVGIGALTGQALGAFLLSVCARLAIVYHGTWCINSVCHMFGKATYDPHSSAKDHWFAALITNGEGYHNYHHHFPGDYRNGIEWYQWDPTKWGIALLERFGWAWDLKRVSIFRILAAKLAAENQRIANRLLEKGEHPEAWTFQSRLQSQYERLRKILSVWEQSVRDYRAVLCRQAADHSEGQRQAALKSLAARRQFQATLAQWKSLSAQLQAV